MEVAQQQQQGQPPPPTQQNGGTDQMATVRAVDPNVTTPTAMAGLRDIGSQVSYLDHTGIIDSLPNQCLGDVVAEFL